MKTAGIESLSVFPGLTMIDAMQLTEHRGLSRERMSKLMMQGKSVAMPYEDPITFAVNAAKPIVDALSDKERSSIEMLITCTESGIDFEKSLSTYVHHYLGLNRSCRLFEIKQACYSGTAGVQTAINFILSQASPGARALVIATDIFWYGTADCNALLGKDLRYHEPCTGEGAVAILISENPHVFKIDKGANGYYGFEVMDAFRPIPDMYAGDTDLSLMTYLDCCETSYRSYIQKLPGTDYQQTFDYLSFHTPFGAMAKGTHRMMMRKFTQCNTMDIDIDFIKRVYPGLVYCMQVGNMMSGMLYLSLASTIEHSEISGESRVGCFSYGSGCCSEFYSGTFNHESKAALKKFSIDKRISDRHSLTNAEFDIVTNGMNTIKFGTRILSPDTQIVPGAWELAKRNGYLYLKEISDYHRKYAWSN
ncbi:hydroxymethylglutaryl-CoA synthase family protein [Chitinophaga sp. Mgbs1]|uniref:Hydroxymethylglutaryl-CoA synthase family protein n=1 Tax=Chitinophaga solisilvae TaxID=1233460 RepID=A0A9Q5CVJ4_9BACT|nr:hydroxymethylglutaryl-CoA synthase family protein [Chitinophaga solisilvae]